MSRDLEKDKDKNKDKNKILDLDLNQVDPTTIDKINLDQVSRDAYQKAYMDWSMRIGTSKLQAKNWRLACMLSLVLLVLLVIAMIAVLGLQKSYVYVAEVQPQDNIVNVRSLDQPYVPTQAQEEYFVAQFIENMMQLPLDPVILRNNWLKAYSVVQGNAQGQLNQYVQSQNPSPFALVGKRTQTVAITQFNAVSDSSYEFNWRVTTYDNNGKLSGQTLYNGIFTVVQGVPPSNEQELLNNPLGLRIEYFSISNEEG